MHVHALCDLQASCRALPRCHSMAQLTGVSESADPCPIMSPRSEHTHTCCVHGYMYRYDAMYMHMCTTYICIYSCIELEARWRVITIRVDRQYEQMTLCSSDKTRWGKQCIYIMPSTPPPCPSIIPLPNFHTKCSRCNTVACT